MRLSRRNYPRRLSSSSITGRKRYPNLPDVPTLWELMDKHKANDADRLKILRDAFAKMMSDPDLIAETKKAGLDPSLTTGESITALGKELGAVSPDLVRRMKQVLEN